MPIRLSVSVDEKLAISNPYNSFSLRRTPLRIFTMHILQFVILCRFACFVGNGSCPPEGVRLSGREGVEKRGARERDAAPLQTLYST